MRPRWQRNCWRFCDPSAPSRTDIPGTDGRLAAGPFPLPASDDAGIFFLYNALCRPAFWRRFPSLGAFATLSAPGIFGGFCRFRRPSALLFAALRRLSCVTAGRRSAPSFLFLRTVVCKDRRPRCMPGRTGRPQKMRCGRFSHLDLFRRICYNQTQQEPLCRHRPARHCQKERRRCHTPQNVNHSLHICHPSADDRCQWSSKIPRTGRTFCPAHAKAVIPCRYVLSAGRRGAVPF